MIAESEARIVEVIRSAIEGRAATVPDTEQPALSLQPAFPLQPALPPQPAPLQNPRDVGDI
jgi:hypothetical protein